MQPLPLKQIHPLWLRCCHWINAVTVAGMICSGWRIYNASPLFSFNYPAALTLGGWLGGALLWHFALMWILLINATIILLWEFVADVSGASFSRCHGPH